MNDTERKKYMDNFKKDLKDGCTYVATLDTCGRKCALCGNPSKLQRCGNCFRIFYCSKDCQRLDWTRHRPDCLEVTRQKPSSSSSQTSPAASAGATASARTNHRADGDGDVASGGGGATAQGKLAPSTSGNTKSDAVASAAVEDTCEVCKRSGDSLKACSRCFAAVYCSKECQRADWKRHKKQCKMEQKSQVESDWEAGKMFEEFVRAVHPELNVPGRRSAKPGLTWPQAVAEARRLNPDKVLLTKLKEVTREEDMDPVLMTSSVFLARLARPHPYVFRHAWYLQDVNGREIRIFFYLDYDVPEPYFKWSQLDIGNYMLLEHAYIHMFMDGTSGIRVDDACDVVIIGH